MKDCVFCKIVNKEIPSGIVYEDTDVVIFKNIEPVATHHLLIIPKKHIEKFIDLGDEILAMTKAAQDIVKKLGISDAYKLVFNGGKYQSIPHVHWHLLAGQLENGKDLLKHL